MVGVRLLDASWLDDLDPATVPFSKRSVTVLLRMGFSDDWSLFNDLTEVKGDYQETLAMKIRQVEGGSEERGAPADLATARVVVSLELRPTGALSARTLVAALRSCP